jgi:hypothetical protein
MYPFASLLSVVENIFPSAFLRLKSTMLTVDNDLKPLPDMARINRVIAVITFLMVLPIIIQQ